ncbi:basement membrane-specific heparan sulfate proteoglycan core protein isoform X2 [Sabethes cyaneus]|uniref:basement membrane-specific heparan sulfate proteoglycan core protein isoform X2 n=1 Tax=Sabethes cyaneus TaxID=53552 RepID=UPI00237E5B01|nr:basement membrane-specific heparan sulfate proteoglycan core protein isoform X2 [Sabethes cyaneus]
MGTGNQILGKSTPIVILITLCIIGVQSIDRKQSDADLVFDDFKMYSVSATGTDGDNRKLLQSGTTKTTNNSVEYNLDANTDIINSEDSSMIVEGEDENWLMRSVYRIKRSIEELLSRKSNPVKQFTKIGRKKKFLKRVKVAKGELSADNIFKKKYKKVEMGKKNEISNVFEASINKRLKHREAPRLRRHFDELTDDEDSESGSGRPENPDYEYKLTLTVFEIYNRHFDDKDSNRFKKVANDVKEKLDALLADLDSEAKFTSAVHKLERDPDDERETFVTFEINVNKSISKHIIDHYLRAAIIQGYENFDMKGYSLTTEDYAEPDPDKTIGLFSEKPPTTEHAYTLSMLDNTKPVHTLSYNEEDEVKVNDSNNKSKKTTKKNFEYPRETQTNAQDKCRGDDKFRCGQTNVFICEVQKCDGQQDCPNGEDEDPVDCLYCTDDEFNCDEEKCIPNTKVCDNEHDCTDGSDEAGCETTRLPIQDCDIDEFTCADSSCIPSEQQCDGQQDCSQGEDETDCSDECSDTEFACDGICLDKEAYCNGLSDCDDGTDEINCIICQPGAFHCSSAECVPSSKRCDGVMDCNDNSDELDCIIAGGGTCKNDQWQCDNGFCINNDFRCDGHVDCTDRSDEYNCPDAGRSDETAKLSLHTYPDEQIIKESREVVFQCRDEGPLRAKVRWVRANGLPLPPGSYESNGRLEIPNIRFDHNGDYICEAIGYPKSTPGSSKNVHLIVERYYPAERPPSACHIAQATCMNGDCIAKSQICDGNFDCGDGSDETGCSKAQNCEPNEFKCRNRKCILKTWRCDGELDCEDSSDEENCATLPPDAACHYDEFQCRSGQCIPKSFQCDSHPDCLDKSDEIGCMTPSVIQPPPSTMTVLAGGVLNISCRATGVPIPLIVWRLNWAHVPEKCNSLNENGFGTLTCNDMQPIDSGAYSCEIINSMGTHFVSPDTIVIVNDNATICRSGYFNSKAKIPEECINCFCFGVSNHCKSADLYTYSLQPPVTSLTIVGVEGPWTGQRQIKESEFTNHDLAVTRHGVQLRLANIIPGRQIPYYSLPAEYKGNQLKSYGGSIRYQVEYDGIGKPNKSPDIIVKGHNMILLYYQSTPFYPDERNSVAAHFLPSVWRKLDNSLATREDIMMALASIESILLKMLYVDGVERNIELLDITMDSAASHDFGLGSATLVEECRCPPGYKGLSCENCDIGYVRQSSGPWLGRCTIKLQDCRPGYYGDPNKGVACQPCPCHIPNDKSKAVTCFLNNYNVVVCNCDKGYIGDRCQLCAPGYIGNPMVGGCLLPPPSNCNPKGTKQILQNGRCLCKTGVTGDYCDRCQLEHFFMNENGCVECFCMGVSRTCTSTSLIKDTLQASFSNGQSGSGFSLISDYINPAIVATDLPTSSREIVYRNFGTSDNTFYWRLPAKFLGNKLGSYGGFLNYTLRYTPHSSGGASRNNSPDVVLHSGNKIKLHHYRTEGSISPAGPSSYIVPILEKHWQNYEDGNKVLRPYLLMALANVSDIFIKATYNTVSNEAALSYVSLDIASEHGSGTRAWPVEQCQCIHGHIGLSCEDCAPGYYKGDGGLYLGLCEKCECNAHSDECDPVTGVCLNCRHNTHGINCEYCRPPYIGNATGGTPYDCLLYEPDDSFNCQHCDPRGSLNLCKDRCECKRLVEGYRCDQCREGSFDLDAQNIDGCRECFCSGVSKACSESRFYREDLPVLITGDDDGFTLTNREGHIIVTEGFAVAPEKNEISYNFRDRNTYYWSLPKRLLGNQILSYGANLTLTQNSVGMEPNPDQDIILIGNGLRLFWSRPHYENGIYSVPLLESYWTTITPKDLHQTSRSDLMTTLSMLDHILIRATVRDYTTKSSISDIVLGTAVNMYTDYGQATEIEMCHCPPGHRGTSCEECTELYYKDVFDRSGSIAGLCKPCPCDNAESCKINGNGDIVCQCLPGYTGFNCETRGSPQKPKVNISTDVIDLEEYKSADVHCVATGSPIPVVAWERMDNRPLSTNVIIEYDSLRFNSLRKADEGTYRCIAKNDIGEADKILHVYVRDIGTHPTRHPENIHEIVQIKPDNYHGISGEKISLSCLCQPSGKITWTKTSESSLPRNSYVRNDLLIIEHATIENSGRYSCTVLFPSGREKTTYVDVIIKHDLTTPKIKPLDTKYTVTQGSDFTLFCEVSGNPFPTTKWTMSGKPFASNLQQTENKLHILNAQLNNGGVYICIAENSEGIDRAYTIVDIERREPPILEIYPKESQIIKVGESTRLSCRATSGVPSPTLSWTRKDRRPLSSHITEDYPGVITLREVNLQDSGEYECKAENSAGSTSLVALIDVQLAPGIIISPPIEEYKIYEGDEINILCTANGKPVPKVEFKLPSHQEMNERHFSKLEGIGSAKLHILHAKLDSSGTYECVASNSAGIDSRFVTIHVEKKRGDLGSHDEDRDTYPRLPYFDRPQKHTYKAILGERSELVCNEASSGARTEWRRTDGRSLPYGSIPSDGQLIIENTGLDAAGTYDCVAHDITSSPTTIVQIVLEVVEPPRITFSPTMPIVVRSGEAVTIICNATGEQPIHISWHGEGDKNLPDRIRVSGQYLQFTQITTDDAGRYYCSAVNRQGNVSKVAEVIVNRNEIIPDIPVHGRIHEVYKGSSISLDCKLPDNHYFSGLKYHWRRIDRPLPYNTRVSDRVLQLNHIQNDDTGRYECRMTYPNGSMAYDFVDVAIKAPQSLPVLRLEPPISYLMPGDSIVVDCTSSSGSQVPVLWERIGGQPLPFNFRQDGNRLIIQDVTEIDTGKYTCVCSTDDGQQYVSDFELIVSQKQQSDIHQTPKVEYADRGSTVKLQCNSYIHPTLFQWSRDRGSFNADLNRTTPILTLTDVQASDAGTYICKTHHNGQVVDASTTLVINGAIPFFPQSPNSYMAFNKIDNAYSKFNFEIFFRPDKLDGLILYNGQKRSNGDYISLFLNHGIPQFRLDFGGQLISLQADKPISMGEWHTIKVNRVRNSGFMLVDDQNPAIFPDKLKFHGVNLDDDLYIGGIQNYSTIPPTATHTKEGFVGCISRLKINGREIQLYQEAIFSYGTTSCESCADDPCQNAGICLETQNDSGYSCVCQQGFTGKDCHLEGKKCIPGFCGDGNCEETTNGAVCYCPIPKTGEFCQYTEHYDDYYAFKDGSYAAYNKFQTKRTIKFRFKPDKLDDCILLYAAESENTFGDFVAIVLYNGRIEFRYSVAGKIPPIILRSTVTIHNNQWHDISAGRSRGGLAYLQVDEEALINEPKIGRPTAILLKSNVYVGGYDKRIFVNPAVGMKKGFEGCISDLEISGNTISMIDDLKHSANIYNCGHQQHSKEIQHRFDEDNEIDPCKAGYGGFHCDIITNICLAHKPCQNGGRCYTKSTGQHYTCECYSGFLGRNCEYVYATNIGSQFRGNGFVEINPKSLVDGSNQYETKLAVMFSTNSYNGMILWYGQRNEDSFSGNDYISLSVHEGFLEFGMRLDGEEAILRNNDVFVADGEQHVAVITREANRNRLEVDHFPSHGETRPTGKQEINLPGNVYIGGAPDLNRFTGERFNENFKGCVYIIENLNTSTAVPLQDFAVRTVNVDICDEIVDLGVEPPVV